MTIQLELTAEQEARFLDAKADQDALGVRAVLSEAVRAQVATWFPPGPPQSIAEFDALLDELGRLVEETAAPGALDRCDVLTREDIYQGYPPL